MTHKTSCSDLAGAMFTLAKEIESEDGIANAAIQEAGERIRELYGQAGVMRGLLAESLEMIGDILEHNELELTDPNRMIFSKMVLALVETR